MYTAPSRTIAPSASNSAIAPSTSSFEVRERLCLGQEARVPRQARGSRLQRVRAAAWQVVVGQSAWQRPVSRCVADQSSIDEVLRHLERLTGIAARDVVDLASHKAEVCDVAEQRAEELAGLLARQRRKCELGAAARERAERVATFGLRIRGECDEDAAAVGLVDQLCEQRRRRLIDLVHVVDCDQERMCAAHAAPPAAKCALQSRGIERRVGEASKFGPHLGCRFASVVCGGRRRARKQLWKVRGRSAERHRIEQVVCERARDRERVTRTRCGRAQDREALCLRFEHAGVQQTRPASAGRPFDHHAGDTAQARISHVPAQLRQHLVASDQRGRREIRA
jgi:hypothetical protein